MRSNCGTASSRAWSEVVSGSFSLSWRDASSATHGVELNREWAALELERGGGDHTACGMRHAARLSVRSVPMVAGATRDAWLGARGAGTRASNLRSSGPATATVSEATACKTSVAHAPVLLPSKLQLPIRSPAAGACSAPSASRTLAAAK